MAGRQACGRCGSSLDDSTADGYCLSCLLREGLGESNGVKPESAGQRFGDYELLEKIGQGGMGIVYRARQINLRRIVAVKLLPFSRFTSEEAVQRFQIEARAAAGLQHPNIVGIHDIGEHEGQHYFSMDFIEGRTLAEVVREEPLPAKQAAGYLKTIAEAVHYAHEQGILHRDLKPSNVLLDAQGRPRVTDFGLARRVEGGSQVTFPDQVIGSPSYVPPEQALGKQDKVSRQSDVYALGAMLYHLLVGRPPFQGETITETLQQVLHSEPVAPRSLDRSIPRDLETICLKCLEKESPRRYPTARELADDLGRFLGDEPIRARPVGAAGRAWKWCRRQPALAGMAAALLSMFLLGLSGVLWQLHRARQAAPNEMHKWGQGAFFASNGQFYAVGDFRVPTRSILDSYVFGGDARLWAVPDGKTLELQVELVSLSSEASSAAIVAAGTGRGMYALYRTSSSAYILKWTSPDRFSLFSCQRTFPRNTNVLLVLALTRLQTNLVITARVLDRQNRDRVLYHQSVLDTPDADPTLTAGQFQALTGIELTNWVADAPDPPLASFMALRGLFQFTDGKQPAPTAVFGDLQVRLHDSPQARPDKLMPPGRRPTSP
jgi:predicted Ser/Thr protein kinase